MDLKTEEEKIGIGDSERCIEIPWALLKYSNEQTVLDIGSANAEERYIKSLLSLKIPNLHGLDISKNEIEGIISHVGDIRNTDFQDNFFDFVFCISTIEHIGLDNSIYKANFTEDFDNGDLDAIKEIYRITKNKGKVVLTVPFGKFFNYGWFIHYDENRLNKLLCSTLFKIVDIDFFKYDEGWHKCDKSELTNILYKDNNAIAAAGLVCLLLEKNEKIPVSIQKGTTYYLDRTMDDNTIELHNDEINVEEIMAKIRENIRKKQAAGELPPDPNSVIAASSENSLARESGNTINDDLSYINSNWDIHNNSYFINSHSFIISSYPSFIGKFLIKGRRLVHREVRRYVDPMISCQTQFNASTVRIITQTSQRCDELNQHQQDLEMAFSSYKHESDKKLTDCISAAKNELNSTIECTIPKLFTQMDKDIHAKAWLAHLLEERIQKGLTQKNESSSKEHTDYFLFEERFRGSRVDIKQRQLAFLPYFEKCSRVLDIGCGRGEFLEILKNHDIGCIGVDSDPDMVAYCRSRQLEVEQSDAIAYIETLEDKSLDGIFIDQVVEHLEPDYLIRLLALCHQKIKFGYYMVVETVNPLSFVSFVNFYIDMTHKRPVHPETLQYLFTASGFRECEKKFFSPVSDEARLKKIEGTADMNATESKIVDVYNHNIDMLNAVLFGAQDYAVVGKK